MSWNTFYELCCRSCLQLSKFVESNTDLTIGDNFLLESEISGQAFIDEQTCEHCGKKGYWWPLERYLNGTSSYLNKTIFTFQVTDEGIIVKNPLNELSAFMSGNEMVLLMKKALELRKHRLINVSTSTDGRGIIFWGLNKNYHVKLPVFIFTAIHYNDITALTNKIQKLLTTT